LTPLSRIPRLRPRRVLSLCASN